MRSFRKLSILVAVFALSAIGAANASAASFTASATGNITGKALQEQIFTTNAGQVKCKKAATSGAIEELVATNQHVQVLYSECTAFGLGGVHISPATYNFTANNTVHIVNDITITVTLGGCTVLVPKGQTVGAIGYKNSGGKIIVEPNVTNIHYKGSGGLCGSTTLSNGTYTGNNETERVGGGSISHHP